MNSAVLTARPDHVPAERVVDFDYYSPPKVEEGFHEAWHALQAEGIPDIVWTPRNGGHWITTSGMLQLEVFADHEHFSNRVVIVPKSIGEQHTMLPVVLDPPEHRPFRALINGPLSPKALNPKEEMIREAAVALIESIAPRGNCDFIADFAAHLPIRVFMALVELPVEDVPKIKLWSDEIVHPSGRMTYADAKAHFYAYLGPYLDQRTGANGMDMISQVINAPVDGRPLSREEMLDLTMQLLLGGLDTVYNFLGFIFLFLARNPGHRRELAEDITLIPAAINELLRRFPVVTMAREIRSDIEWHGVSLKKGEMILAASPIVGLDARLNAAPFEVNFRRRSVVHASFGKGPHLCAGAHLARMELRVTLEEWLSHIPDFEVDPGAEITFRGGIVGSVTELPLIWTPSPQEQETSYADR